MTIKTEAEGFSKQAKPLRLWGKKSLWKILVILITDM